MSGTEPIDVRRDGTQVLAGSARELREEMRRAVVALRRANEHATTPRSLHMHPETLEDVLLDPDIISDVVRLSDRPALGFFFCGVPVTQDPSLERGRAWIGW